MPKELKKELSNQTAITQCAEQFGLVGDPTRMKICWLLCHHKELSVTDIATMLDVSVSVVSHSLKKLKENNMVEIRQEHRKRFYKLGHSPFVSIVKTSLKNV